MGNTWEVYAYVRNDDPSQPGIGYGQQYYYELVHRGESIVGVIRAALQAKKAGAGCIKIEYRP